MPLWKRIDRNSHQQIAIWKIDEPLSFFNSGISIAPEISHPKRQVEFACGRYLLRYLMPEFPVEQIRTDDQDKPRIDIPGLEFSISHSFPYVAVFISHEKECGIDIQVWHPRIQRIKNKFLGDAEQKLTGTDDRSLIAAWTAKEAAYKYFGKKGLSLVEGLPISFFRENLPDFEAEITHQHDANMEKIMLSGFYAADFAICYTN